MTNHESDRHAVSVGLARWSLASRENVAATMNLRNWKCLSEVIESIEWDVWGAFQPALEQITANGSRAFTTTQLADATGCDLRTTGVYLRDVAVETLHLIVPEFEDSDPREYDVTTAHWRLAAVGFAAEEANCPQRASHYGAEICTDCGWTGPEFWTSPATSQDPQGTPA